MKLVAAVFTLIAAATAAQLPSSEYLPPFESNYVEQAPTPVYHAPAPAPAIHYAPAPVYHAPAPVYHAPAPVYHAVEQPTQEYLPPISQDSHTLSADGYRYKTAKRFRFRSRRH